MPELPEVEVTRRGIAGPLQGARIVAVRLGKPLRWPLGRDADDLVGATIGPVQRRGKYLWLPLSREVQSADAGRPAGLPRRPPVAPRPGPLPAAGEQGVAQPTGGGAEGGLLLHLGMSGSLTWRAGGVPAAGPHDHFDLVTPQGTLRLHDPRRFGAVVWSPSLEQDPAARLLRRLGVEPLDGALDAAAFHRALRERRSPIKAVLLSGEVVVGAGNIYACEALHRAGIHPALSACRISAPRAARLLEAVRATLAQAVELGGSTLRDFTDVHGASGAYQASAAVYGRAGQPCPACGRAVRRIVQGQRATYFCAGCQRR